jgi:lysophospholipase L1-like esterase
VKRHPSGAGPALALLVALVVGLGTPGAPAVAQTPAGFNSTRPSERIEYWQKRLGEIDARMAQPDSLADVRLLFLGDSITDFWTMGDNPWFPGAVGGRAVWDETFGGGDPSRVGLNLGISGDRTEHVLYRIQPRSEGGPGQLDRPDLNPDVVVLMIGINNSWDAETPAVDSVVAGVRAVVAAVHARKPDALIVLQSLLPTNEPDRNAGLVIPVNAALAGFAMEPDQAGHVRYLDLYPVFLGADGQQNRAFFMDGVHPNEDGYRAWRDRLVPFLSTIDQGGAA